MTHEVFNFKRAKEQIVDIFDKKTLDEINRKIMAEAEEWIRIANLSSYETVNIPVSSAEHGANKPFYDKNGKEYRGNIWITHFDKNKTYGLAIVRREKIFN